MELYVHIPFCIRKCNYCDFLSFPCGGKDSCFETGAACVPGEAYTAQLERYADALITELHTRRAETRGQRCTTAFIGGGTPSVLPAGIMGRILEAVAEYGPFDEFTVECNPGTLDRDKLMLYRHYGVSRISLGLQSADNEELRLLGRIHTYETFLESYRLVREAGFDNINIDLMSAIPGQTLESWISTLDRVTALRPEHISAYSLIVEPGTPFWSLYGEEAARDRVSRSDGDTASGPAPMPGEGTARDPAPLPDEDTEREMYRVTGERLAAAGYARYEISNYSLAGHECRHNLGYWTGEEYIGCGLGAASYLLRGNGAAAEPRDDAEASFAAVRYKNTDSMDDYCNDPTGTRAVDELLEKDDLMSEYAILHLRLMSGIDAVEFRERFGVCPREVFGEAIGRHVRNGLLRITDPHIALTERGISLSNTVMADFLL